MSRAFAFVLALASCFIHTAALGQETDTAPKTQARAHLEPSGPVVAGTDVKLIVDVMTTTYFTDAPEWPAWNVDDAVVSPPDEQATNLSETIDGVRWFGVSRTYRIAPQAAKTFRIPPIAITIHPGGIATPVVVTTPALSFVATVPPGAEHMTTFFATTALSASQRIAPATEKIQVGDAVTRSITQHAAGTRSMLIPPIAFADVDGLHRTTNPGATHDVVEDRAGLVAGERTDSATYIADRSGHITLPAITIEWWNAAARRSETIALPAVSLSVVAAHERPVFDIPADALTGGLRHHIVVIDRMQVVIACAIVAAGFALVWLWPRVVVRYRHARVWLRVRRQRWADSDIKAWLALRRIARRGSMHDVIPALYRWADRRVDEQAGQRADGGVNGPAHPYGERDGRPARLGCVFDTASEDGKAVVQAIAAHYAADLGSDSAAQHAASRPAVNATSIDPRTLSRVAHAARRRARQAARERNTDVPPLNPF